MQAEASKVAGGEVMTQEERINELEKKINELEVKLMNTLDILRVVINLDRGLDNDTTEWLVKKVENLERF
jgi:hypothetical protein